MDERDRKADFVQRFKATLMEKLHDEFGLETLMLGDGDGIWLRYKVKNAK